MRRLFRYGPVVWLRLLWWDIGRAIDPVKWRIEGWTVRRDIEARRRARAKGTMPKVGHHPVTLAFRGVTQVAVERCPECGSNNPAGEACPYKHDGQRLTMKEHLNSLSQP